MAKRKDSAAINELAIELFNEVVPIGTAVKYRNDDGETEERITRSEAWMLGGHTPVVQFKGFPGCFALDRVTVRVKRPVDM